MLVLVLVLVLVLSATTVDLRERERQIFLPLAMLLLGLPRTVVHGVVDAFTIQASIMMSTMIAIIVSVVS